MWRKFDKAETVSLPEIYESVKIPHYWKWWKRLFAFLGPAYLVSVGYMDPGNWATDLEGGAKFGYRLIWVLLASNLMAVLLQMLSARLGLVTRCDLAQACREAYPPFVYYPLWIICELAIAACDLAEVLGTAIGLNLLFGIPLIIGVSLTALDTILLLFIQRYGIRKFEGMILGLVFVVGCCFVVEIFLAKPDFRSIIGGFIPTIDRESLYVALGMLGATVMPHNLYLHSALVQSRAVERTDKGIRAAVRFNLIDTFIALNAAFFVNSAILVLSSSVFYSRGIEVVEIQQAHELLSPLLGTGLASTAFAVALLAAGQSSTLTGTLAGQVVMEGFIRIKIQPWARRLISRLLAIIPAVIVIAISGSHGTYRLLILSQVILSLQLPFAIVPLIQFTSDREWMGKFVSPLWVRVLSWLVALFIISLNVWLVWVTVSEWRMKAMWVDFIVIPIGAYLMLLLGYMGFGPFIKKLLEKKPPSVPEPVLPSIQEDTGYGKIGVALEVRETDQKILKHALALATRYNAEIILIHIVESATAQVWGGTVEDRERTEDEDYLIKLSEKIRAQGIRASFRIGFGNAAKGVVKIAKEENLDLLVLGSHGHKHIKDWIYGSTVSAVQHDIGDIPILVVKGT